jgi:hypothetical protein
MISIVKFLGDDYPSKLFSEYSEFVLCKYEKTGTYHIFPARRVTLDSCNRAIDKPCCGASLVVQELQCKSECLTRKQVRTLCAEMANNSKNICGICVATFYKL